MQLNRYLRVLEWRCLMGVGLKADLRGHRDGPHPVAVNVPSSSMFKAGVEFWTLRERRAWEIIGYMQRTSHKLTEWWSSLKEMSVLALLCPTPLFMCFICQVIKCLISHHHQLTFFNLAIKLSFFPSMLHYNLFCARFCCWQVGDS